MTAPILSLRELNRATLARQLLLERAPVRAVTAIGRLGPLQAQYSPSPYVALWSRLQDFTREELTRAIERRAVVKATLLRGTLHLTTARDYSFYSAILAESGARHWKVAAKVARLSTEALRDAVDEYLREPRTSLELAAFLGTLAPRGRHHPAVVRWRLIHAHGGLMHAYPSGTWRTFGSARLLAARHALRGHRMAEPLTAYRRIARQYLGAYGPASRADLSSWSGIPVSYWREALVSMKLLTFRDEHGRELVDLPHAPRPSGDAPAPVRYLSKWDNVLLAFKDRARVLQAVHRQVIVGPNGDFAQMFMVDGQVAGVWASSRKRDAAVLELQPFARLAPGIRRALAVEGEGLLRFVEPDADRYTVRA